MFDTRHSSRVNHYSTPTRTECGSKTCCTSGPRDHMTSAVQHLHWLPVQPRIIYKLCLLMHLVNTGRAPSDLESVTATAARTVLGHVSALRAVVVTSSHVYTEKVRRIYYAFAGPHYWNTLPAALQQQSNTARLKRHIKMFLSEQAYNN